MSDSNQKQDNSPEETKKDANKEQKSVEQLEHHIEDLSDRLLRTMAENENMRKRYEKQLDDMRDYSISNFAKDLISVVDNLERALKFVPESISPEHKSLLSGVELTLKELAGIFHKNGIEAIEPHAGDKFDYNLHFAISKVESEEHNPDTIVGLMQVGYKIKDRLLRPAAVSVAKARE